MRKRIITLCLGLLAVLPTAAAAQISPTYTFVDGTVISAAQVNANFALLGQALNRTGGTMLGTLTARDLFPVADATYDVGSGTHRFRDGHFQRTLYTGTVGLIDSNATHHLLVAAGSNLTTNRTLTISTGDADRLVTLTGNPTLGDWFNQSVKSTAWTQFGRLLLGGTQDATQWQLRIDGTLTDTGNIVTNMYGMLLWPTLLLSANDSTAAALHMNPTVEAPSGGSVGNIAGMYLNAPAITTNGATITRASTVYIHAAPSGATSNWALYINNGNVAMNGAVTVGSLASTGGVRERGRGYDMGVTQNTGYNSAHYSADSGTWSVGSNDLVTNSWRLIGDTLFWTVRLVNTTVSAGPGLNPVELRVTLPNGFTAQETVQTVATSSEGIAGRDIPFSYVTIAAGSTYAAVRRGALIAWDNIANGENIAFQIAVKVQ